MIAGLRVKQLLRMQLKIDKGERLACFVTIVQERSLAMPMSFDSKASNIGRKGPDCDDSNQVWQDYVASSMRTMLWSEMCSHMC